MVLKFMSLVLLPCGNQYTDFKGSNITCESWRKSKPCWQPASTWFPTAIRILDLIPAPLDPVRRHHGAWPHWQTEL